jgi:hypothetical protein
LNDNDTVDVQLRNIKRAVLVLCLSPDIRAQRSLKLLDHLTRSMRESVALDPTPNNNNNNNNSVTDSSDLLLSRSASNDDVEGASSSSISSAPLEIREKATDDSVSSNPSSVSSTSTTPKADEGYIDGQSSEQQQQPQQPQQDVSVAVASTSSSISPTTSIGNAAASYKNLSQLKDIMFSLRLQLTVCLMPSLDRQQDQDQVLIHQVDR